MMKTFRVLMVVVPVLLLLFGCPMGVEQSAVDEELLMKGASREDVTPTMYLDGKPIELWAGSPANGDGFKVGTIDLKVNGAMLDVTYHLDTSLFPWVVTEIHFHMGPNVDSFPVTKQGNPIPGQFKYNLEVDPAMAERTYSFPLPSYDPIYVAFHAVVVKYGGLEGFNYYLPNEEVSLHVVSNPAPGGTSYWRFEISDGEFTSVYDGWCIDTDHSIGTGYYTAQLYSSYEELPAWMKVNGMIEYPGNLDMVNYLVNNFAVGQLVQPSNSDGSPRIDPSTGLPYPVEALTYSDIQRAIWALIENNQSTAGLSGWSQYRVNAILYDVSNNGEGFTPICGDKVVFIVVPLVGEKHPLQFVIGQPMIGGVDVPCETLSETAWADGKTGANFPGAKQWATYFVYDR